MDDAELHYPPGAEPEKPPVEEQPKQEKAPEADPPKEETPKEEPKADEPPTEEDKGEKAPQDPPADIKKRSIYDDLKDEKKDRKGWQSVAIAAVKAQGIELKGTESLDEIQALLHHKEDAKTPEQKSDADDDIKAFLEAEGLTPEQFDKLSDVVAKKLGRQQLPEDVQKELEANREFREKQEAADRRAAEDREIEKRADYVKETLKVHDEGELATVMAEVKRLAHTKDFHDKEVEYIIFRNMGALAKLVSPKRKSFEESSGHKGEGSEAAPDFSSGKVTPAQAQASVQPSRASYSVTHPQ